VSEKITKQIAKQVNIDRVYRLIECYGASAERWPQDERDAAQLLIQSSVELQQWHAEAARLDCIINDATSIDQTNFTRGSQIDIEKIMNHLPAQNSFVGVWDRLWNKPVLMAASIATIMLLVIFVFQSQPVINTQSDINVAQVELDLWMWEEATNIRQNKIDEDLTFMALVDLE